MQKQRKEAVEWVSYDLFHDIPWIQQGTTLRHRGYSRTPYASLNMSFAVGDEEMAVQKNREIVREMLAKAPLYIPNQCHGKNVVMITKQSSQQIPECDALITQEKGVILGVTHADCQAAIFLDPIHQAIGVVHAGWRGNVQNIYRETIIAMQKAFGTQPQDLLVSISPSLSPEMAEFRNYTEEFPEELWLYQIKPHFFDLWSLAKDQLGEMGVQENHMETARICTYCHPENYFSFRRDHTTGRHLTYAMITE